MRLPWKRVYHDDSNDTNGDVIDDDGHDSDDNDADDVDDDHGNSHGRDDCDMMRRRIS